LDGSVNVQYHFSLSSGLEEEREEEREEELEDPVWMMLLAGRLLVVIIKKQEFLFPQVYTALFMDSVL
jgi:hypothetical protein